MTFASREFRRWIALIDHRAAEGGEVKVAARVVGDEGEVHVPQVVIDRPAPGQPADHLNLVGPHIVGVDRSPSGSGAANI